MEKNRVTIDHEGTRINLDIPTDRMETGGAQASVDDVRQQNRFIDRLFDLAA